MRKTIFVVCLLLASLACMPAASAQDNNAQSAGKSAEPVHFYRLKLVVQELNADGKITNSRSYSTIISTDLRSQRPNSIRTKTQVPESTSTIQKQDFTYVNVEANFDIHDMKEFGHQLSFHISADISSYAGNAPIGDSTWTQPVIRHNQWESSVLIPIDKPTVIFNSDALDSKGAMQVVATATPIPE